MAAVLVVAATWAAGSGGVRAAGWPELQALASCDDGVVVQLTGDVSERQTLVVGCDATIDLNGRTLNVISTDVRANLTIDDTAGGGRYEATLQNDGLAGIHVPAGTSVTIRAGHIDAWGGAGAAGIGGQPGEDAGSVTILGGTVVAQGGGRAAAIGAPTGGDGGIIDIDAGTVYATGGANAPGIGSGCGGGDATLRIGEHATAVVDTFDFSIICEAHALRLAGPLPVLQVDGVLSLRHGITGRGASWAIAVPAGPPAAIVVGPTGTIMGPQNNPTTNARFSGAGSIDNHGVIALDESLVQAEVTDHNYLLTFEPAGGPTQRIRVFAPDFASSYRTAPALTPWLRLVGRRRGPLVAAGRTADP